MTKHHNTMRVNGADLYYEMAGSGYPLVLIHGFSLDHRMWDDQFHEFARRYQVVRYDARGFGRSSLPSGQPYSHGDDLKTLLGHLNIGHTVLIGFSMGAEIALDLALTAPELVTGLVLAGAFLHDFQWQTFGQDYRPVIDAAKTSGARAARDVWLTRAIFKPAMATPSVGARLIQMISDYSGWHFNHKDPQRRPETPVRQRLGRIATRTLVAVGEDDLDDFRAIAHMLRCRIPDAVSIDIPQSGHFISMENVKSFNRHVGRFLAETIPR